MASASNGTLNMLSKMKGQSRETVIFTVLIKMKMMKYPGRYGLEMERRCRVLVMYGNQGVQKKGFDQGRDRVQQSYVRSGSFS